MKLRDYVQVHTLKIEGNAPPKSPTIDMLFFRVAVSNEATADRLRALIVEHKSEWGPVDPLDGQEHSYLELGAWLGDQGTALLLMALGAKVGLWSLVTPITMLGAAISRDDALRLAGQGFVAIIAATQRC